MTSPMTSPGNPTFERDGRVYEIEYYVPGKHAHYTLRIGGVPGDVPEVLCGECHADGFTLRYGSYEVLARCIACGYEAVVYEG